MVTVARGHPKGALLTMLSLLVDNFPRLRRRARGRQHHCRLGVRVVERHPGHVPTVGLNDVPLGVAREGAAVDEDCAKRARGAEGVEDADAVLRGDGALAVEPRLR